MVLSWFAVGDANFPQRNGRIIRKGYGMTREIEISLYKTEVCLKKLNCLIYLAVTYMHRPCYKLFAHSTLIDLFLTSYTRSPIVHFICVLFLPREREVNMDLFKAV